MKETLGRTQKTMNRLRPKSLQCNFTKVNLNLRLNLRSNSPSLPTRRYRVKFWQSIQNKPFKEVICSRLSLRKKSARESKYYRKDTRDKKVWTAENQSSHNESILAQHESPAKTIQRIWRNM